MQIVLLQIFEI